MRPPASRGSQRRGIISLYGLVLAFAACATVLATGASASSSYRSDSPPAPTRAPLDGSITTAVGVWVDLAMGDLGQLANTFWQLFFLPDGGSRWSLVTPPGFADNGGLVSVQVGSSLLSGFEASQQIAFSPLASSSDGGKNWTPGILSSELAEVPDALAGGPNGQVVALTGGSAPAVESDSSGLSNWHRLVSARAIDLSRVGRACGVTALTAVSFSPSGRLLVGAACSRPGEVGVLEDSPHGWRLAGPSLVSSGSATMSVLRLRSFGGGVSALIATSSGARTELLGTRLTGVSGWSRPVALSLGDTERLVSSGIAANGSLAVLLASAGRPVADVLMAGARSWTELPRVPSRTTAISFDPTGDLGALAVDRSELLIYRLAGAEASWQRAQVMRVPIQYGSSS